MGFLDKAKQAANDMAAKADQAMANAGIAGPPGGIASMGGNRGADGILRDFGLISWREAHGQPVDATEKEKVVQALRAMESSGQLAALRVNTGTSVGGGLFGAPPPGAPPPPPGAAAAAAQSGGYAAPPPPVGANPSPAAPEQSTGSKAAAPEQGQSGGGTAPPPPPPSWA